MAANHTEEFDQLMMSLGSVVIIWGMVEDGIRKLMDDVILRDETDDKVSRIIMAESSFRSQLDMLRKVAHLRRPDTSWYQTLDGIIGQLRGPLHAKRNRYIHDLWMKTEDGQTMKIVRGSEEVGIKKKDGKVTLTWADPQPAIVEEVEQFFEEVADVCEKLTDLWADYHAWQIEQQAGAALKSQFAELSERAAAKLAEADYSPEKAVIPLRELLARSKSGDDERGA